jgi:hypothetical protein
MLVAKALLQPEWIHSMYAHRAFVLSERLLTEARVLWFYIGQIIAPDNTTLGLYHDDIPLSQGWMTPPTTIPAVLGHVVLIGAALFALHRAPLIALGILWFYAGHLLESSFLPLEIAYEHRNYLPSLGVLVALCAVAGQLRERLLGRRWRGALAVLFIGFFASLTALRASAWQDDLSHAILEAAHHPDSPRSATVLAAIYSRLVYSGRKEFIAQAVQEGERAIALEQNDIGPNANLILVSQFVGHPVERRWFEDTLDKLRNRPPAPGSLQAFGEILRCQTTFCPKNPQDMEALYQAALSNPRIRASDFNLGFVYAFYGRYLISDAGRDAERGLECFRLAVHALPEEPQYRINLINLLIALKRPDDARRELDVLRDIAPIGRFGAEIRELEHDLSQFMAGMAS